MYIRSLTDIFTYKKATRFAQTRWWWFVAGVGVGLGAAVVAELFALLASRGH